MVNTIYDEVQLFEKIKPSPCRGTLSFEDNLSLSSVNFNYSNTKSPTLIDKEVLSVLLEKVVQVKVLWLI